MTMLGYVDGNNFQDGVSYLEIVEFLTKNSLRTSTLLSGVFSHSINSGKGRE